MQTRIDGVGIKHIAACVPVTEVRTLEYVKCRGVDNLNRVIKKIGIHSIRITKPGQTTADLCQKAAETIFAHGYDKNNICAIIFVSKTPDHIVNPPTSCLLQTRLGLGQEVLCYDSMAACYGFIGGMQFAALLSKQFGKDVLLLTGDTNSKLVNQKDSAAVMFGDGGTASIVGLMDDNFLDIAIRNNGSKWEVCSTHDGGYRYPLSAKSLVEIEDERGNIRRPIEMDLHGLDMMNFVLNDASALIDETIKYFGGKNKFDLFMLHQPNEMIVKSLATILDLPMEKIPLFVDGYGNVSSGSIPLGLCLSRESDLLNNGNKIFTLMSGYGAGASWGTVVTDLGKTKFYKVVELE